MSYAVDLLTALFCAVAAALYVSQIKSTRIYARRIGPDGQLVPGGPIDLSAPPDEEPDVEIEVFTTLSHNPHCAPPQEEGWQRQEDQPPDWKNYVNAGFGLVLAIGAVGLALGAFLPTTPIAWLLASASAIALAVDLPRLAGQFIDREVFLLMFAPQVIVAIGAFAAYRLF